MKNLWFNFRRKTFGTWAYKLGVGDEVKHSYYFDYDFITEWKNREAEYKKERFGILC